MNNPVSPDKLDDLHRRMSDLGIHETQLTEKFVRGSGSGGQKINKTSNCVFLKHEPSGIAIKCQIDRSRELNRFFARRELCCQLEAIRDGKTSAKSQAIEKMRKQKRQRAKRSKKRHLNQTKNTHIKPDHPSSTTD